VTKPEVERPVPPPTKLSWRRKLLFATLTAGGFLLLLELVLAALGIRPVRSLRDPFVGFEPGAPLFVRQGDRYVTNPVKLCFFNPQEFPAAKSPRACRIFCLGGSTTYGHPYDHRTYFGSWLRAYLQEAAPERDWEVVNCGGISYASYRIALLMDELVRYEPDLFIVYTGHNEFLEERTYGELRRRNRALVGLLRAASYSRVFQLMQASLRPAPREPTSRLPGEVATRLEIVGPEAYHRDRPWQRAVLEHFRSSVTRIVDQAHGAGAQIIFVHPAANLKDFTPFKSEHTAGLSAEQVERWKALIRDGRRVQAAGDPQRAVTLLREAEQLNPERAMGLWYLGDALLAAGQQEESLRYFVRAKDEDVCPLRALSEIGEILTEVSREQHVTLVDFPQLLVDKYGVLPAVGLDCFLDHVHPTLRVHADLGRALAHQLAVEGVTRDFEDSTALDERVDRRVRGSLTPYDHVMALNTLAMTLSWAGKNEEALRLAETAVEAAPQNSEILAQYGRLLEKLHRDDEALQAYQKAVQANPEDSHALARLGRLYGQRGDFAAARGYLQRAVQLTPDKAPLAFRAEIRLQLGDCLQALGEPAAAQDLYREAAQIDAQFPGLHDRLRDRRR
jgi:tetratricopeptide (TPR) repeat protein